MKIFRKHSIVIFCLACVLLLSVSCERPDLSKDSTLRVPISLRSADGGTYLDKQIKTIRVIFFSSTGSLVSNWLYTIPPGSNPSVITGEMTIGINNIYIICNETPGLERSLSNITTQNEMVDIRFIPPIDGITDPVPMFCYIPDVNIERGEGTAVKVTIGAETKPYLDATVTRIVAKIGMKVIKNVPTDEVDFSIEKISYRICNVPAYSMLSDQGARYAQGEPWAANIKVEGQGSIAASSNGKYVVTGDVVSTEPTNLDAIYCPAIYIPEHKPQVPENPDYGTYLLIEAECKTKNSLTPIRSIYRVNIGKLPPTDLSIERNVNYQVYLTITGLGATGFYAEIVPVDEYDLPITWKPSAGYAIVGERVEDYGVNVNIWKSYSQYSGILKVVNDMTYSDVCFRYGSVVALSATATAGAFDPTTDILWMPEVTKNATTINSWDDVGYLTSEDVSGTTHTLENIKKGKGDPCRLVGLSESEIAAGEINNELWRLPTKSEMEWLVTAQNYTADTRGFYSFSTLLTPFNGYRSETGEMVPSDATAGHYWSATAANSFTFTASTPTIANDNPKKAYGVRCLRTDIPESIFNVNSVHIGYLGGMGKLTTSANNVNTPYWRMEVDPAFASQVTLGKNEGASKEEIPITINPLPDVYKKGEYLVNVIGYGLDGQVHRTTTIVIQSGLHHEVKVNWTSVPEFIKSEGYYRVPVDGATISFTIDITPDPLPYNPGFDDMLWRIKCIYYTDVVTTLYGTNAKRGEASVVTIPKNIRGNILGIEYSMVPVVAINYPFHTSERGLFLQNVK